MISLGGSLKDPKPHTDSAEACCEIVIQVLLWCSKHHFAAFCFCPEGAVSHSALHLGNTRASATQSHGGGLPYRAFFDGEYTKASV